MNECDEIEVNSKTRYIKFKQDSSIGESAESEQGESEEATGGETAGDENASEQIFFETTVWIVKHSKNNWKQKKKSQQHTVNIAVLSTSFINKHDPSSDLESIPNIVITPKTMRFVLLFVQWTNGNLHIFKL